MNNKIIMKSLLMIMMLLFSTVSYVSHMQFGEVILVRQQIVP